MVVEEAVVVAAAAEDCNRGVRGSRGVRREVKRKVNAVAQSQPRRSTNPKHQRQKERRTLVVVGATQAEEVAAAAVDEV